MGAAVTNDDKLAERLRFLQNGNALLTHISLMSLYWDIGKQCRPRLDASDTNELGVWSGTILFAYRNFCQDQDQDSLLVKRRNDDHSPGPVIRELVPSSHQRSELSNTILCIFSG